MIRKLLFLLISFVFISSCSSNRTKISELKTQLDSLSEEDLSALEVFFRALLSKSQGGYVLYGNKPLCIEAFVHREEGSIFLTKWIHVFSTELKRGATLWKELNLNKYCKNYQLNISEIQTNEWRDLLLFNKKELLFCIENNRPLFQYVLGPSLTAKQMLNQLLDSNKNFSSLIRKDKVLIGILLGYGTQNALCCSRMETIQESINTKPTLGFETIEEEASWLNSQFSLSTDYSEEKAPLLPWFGCYDLNESQSLIAHYKKAQKEIANVLKSKNFLEKVLSKMFEETISLKPYNRLADPLLPEREELTKCAALGIWHCISQKDPDYISSFIQGLQANEHNTPPLSEEEFCSLRNRYCAVVNSGETNSPVYSKMHHEIAYSAGLRAWDHFKQAKNLYSLSDILACLSNLQSDASADRITSETDKVLTNLHWILYKLENEKISDLF